MSLSEFWSSNQDCSVSVRISADLDYNLEFLEIIKQISTYWLIR